MRSPLVLLTLNFAIGMYSSVVCQTILYIKYIILACKFS